PHDDGARHRSSPGLRGVRGDVRLAAVARADDSLANAHFPDTGDIVLGADEGPRFAATHGDFLTLRNVLMHEIGHVLGLGHVHSSDARWLMEPTLDLAFDGPQLDDLRGLHYLYGDALETPGGEAGNDTFALATPLGGLSPGDELTLGLDAGEGHAVDRTDVDFVSISNSGDLDFFSFEASGPALLDVVLEPRGGVFRQAEIGGMEHFIDAAASNDLSATLFNSEQVAVAIADRGAIGEVESLDDVMLPSAGRYYLRVSGNRDLVQLYSLQIRLSEVSVVAEPPTVLLAAALATLLALPITRLALPMPATVRGSRHAALVMQIRPYRGASGAGGISPKRRI
ncbi:MAG: matrixin family metalloprotease, partial [Planctomycetota bacterium]